MRWQVSHDPPTVTLFDGTTLDLRAAIGKIAVLRDGIARATRIVLVTDDSSDPITRMLADAPEVLERIRRGETQVTLRSPDEVDREEAWSLARGFVMNDRDRAAFEATRREVESSSLAHWTPPPVDLRKAPISSRDLDEGTPRIAIVNGPLAPYVGPRIAPERMIDDDKGTSRAHAECVSAFTVPAMIHRVIRIAEFESIAAALEAFASRHCGGHRFHVDSRTFGGPGKYLHLHSALIAPPEGDVLMALEIYGRILAVGGIELGSLEGGRWIRSRRNSRDRDSSGKDMPFPWFVRIESATYANVRYAGVGVPFYA